MRKAEIGIIRLKFQSIDPKELVNISVNPFKTQIEEKEINLEIHIPEVEPITADAEKICWVLTNFIGNALRYTPRWGKIKIRITQRPKETEFSVEDSGYGIDPQTQSRIFEPLTGDGESTVKGGGLALAISREIIEAHGGTIGVESQVGRGSRFYFILPNSVI
ncbi:MAG: HAMP domain-containing histidine kinase [Leptospiraceae bacterium]|nr:HAMP domain-containing histidine kinase [Leptospiraceae bacterium]MDW8307148.1 HAMP domain-containing sensor histidine kinase [Leptospiraceae bacterium]